MHRTQTDDIEFKGCRLRVRYALIYGHDEGWKLGKIESIRRIHKDVVGCEMIDSISQSVLKGIEEHVAETINRDCN